MKLSAPATATLSAEVSRLQWTAAIVVAATLPHWPTLPLWVPVLLGVAIAWRLAVATLAWPMPIRTLRLLLALVAFCCVLFTYRTINGVEAGSALLVVMIALKVLESKGHRDQLVLIMISYFLLFASLLIARGPLTAVYLLLLIWLTTIGLLQLSRRGPLLGLRPTAALAGRLLLQSLPLMIALFVLFPRLPGPLWAVPGSSTSATSGLGDTVNPGDITSLALSDDIAFRAQFLSRPPPARELYWRGPTMTNFDGRTWSMQIGDRRYERIAASTEYLGAPTEYRVMLETNGRNWAFALDMPKPPDQRGLRMASDYGLRTFPGTPRGTRLDYHVVSYTSYRALEPLVPAEQKLFKELPPESSPRTRELVRGWLADDPSPEQLIERGMNWLRSQPFFYTLTPPALGGQPVDEFLLGTREGFCEHYASAFTVMMRAAGLPARIVTGYQGGELNGIGGYYIIRQSDAHAWTEVWLADRGWVRVDPVSAVAPDRVALGSWRSALAGQRVPGSALGRIEWVRRAFLAWDAAATFWNDWVIGYGPELQRALLDMLGFDGAPRAERWSKLLLLCVGATLAGSLLVSLQLAWRRRHRTTVDAAAREFATFTKRLAKLQVAPRAPSEGPIAYGARAQSRAPQAAAEIRAIVAAYLRARYECDADSSALTELRARVASFRPAPA
jgi:transglutaminase-like putative cysteine protease